MKVGLAWTSFTASPWAHHDGSFLMKPTTTPLRQPTSGSSRGGGALPIALRWSGNGQCHVCCDRRRVDGLCIILDRPANELSRQHGSRARFQIDSDYTTKSVSPGVFPTPSSPRTVLASAAGCRRALLQAGGGARLVPTGSGPCKLSASFSARTLLKEMSGTISPFRKEKRGLLVHDLCHPPSGRP